MVADYLPYSFQKMKIGPLVGTKTWGGLVGWTNEPPLIDGHDPQLEKAIEITLEMLKTEGVKLNPQPADPVSIVPL